MSDKEDKARALFADGYNCAQAVIGAFCEENGLDTRTALKLANGFGGGVRCGEICGAVSGAIMTIGLECGFYKEKDFDQKNYCNGKTVEFLQKFREENGSILCRDLLGVDIHTPEDHLKPGVPELHKTICPEKIASSVRILESMEYEG